MYEHIEFRPERAAYKAAVEDLEAAERKLAAVEAAVFRAEEALQEARFPLRAARRAYRLASDRVREATPRVISEHYALAPAVNQAEPPEDEDDHSAEWDAKCDADEAAAENASEADERAYEAQLWRDEPQPWQQFEAEHFEPEDRP